jgi:hypothetical protein
MDELAPPKSLRRVRASLGLRGSLARVTPGSLRTIMSLKAQPPKKVVGAISEPSMPVHITAGTAIEMRRDSFQVLPPKERAPARLSTPTPLHPLRLHPLRRPLPDLPPREGAPARFSTPTPLHPLWHPLPDLPLNEQNPARHSFYSGPIERKQASNCFQIVREPVHAKHSSRAPALEQMAEVPATMATAIPGPRQASRNRHTYHGTPIGFAAVDAQITTAHTRVISSPPAVGVTKPDRMLGMPEDSYSRNLAPTRTNTDFTDPTQRRLEVLFRHNRILAERNTNLEHSLEEAHRQASGWKQLYEQEVAQSRHTSNTQHHYGRSDGLRNDTRRFNQPGLYDSQYLGYEEEDEEYETERYFMDLENSSSHARSSNLIETDHDTEEKQLATPTDQDFQENIFDHNDYAWLEENTTLDDTNYPTAPTHSSSLERARKGKAPLLEDSEAAEYGEELTDAFETDHDEYNEYDYEEPQLHTATAIHPARLPYGIARIEVRPSTIRVQNIPMFNEQESLCSPGTSESPDSILPDKLLIWDWDAQRWSGQPDLSLTLPTSAAPASDRILKRRGGFFR